MTNEETIDFMSGLSRETADIYRTLAHAIEHGELTLTDVETIVQGLAELTIATREFNAKIKDMIAVIH